MGPLVESHRHVGARTGNLHLDTIDRHKPCVRPQIAADNGKSHLVVDPGRADPTRDNHTCTHSRRINVGFHAPTAQRVLPQIRNTHNVVNPVEGQRPAAFGLIRGIKIGWIQRIQRIAGIGILIRTQERNQSRGDPVHIVFAEHFLAVSQAIVVRVFQARIGAEFLLLGIGQAVTIRISPDVGVILGIDRIAAGQVLVQIVQAVLILIAGRLSHAVEALEPVRQTIGISVVDTVHHHNRCAVDPLPGAVIPQCHPVVVGLDRIDLGIGQPRMREVLDTGPAIVEAVVTQQILFRNRHKLAPVLIELGLRPGHPPNPDFVDVSIGPGVTSSERHAAIGVNRLKPDLVGSEDQVENGVGVDVEA